MKIHTHFFGNRSPLWKFTPRIHPVHVSDMKREIRIILSIIVLLVGLIFAALFRPSAPSASEEEGSEIAVAKSPVYSQNVSYAVKTLPVRIDAPRVNVPALPRPEKVLPVPEEAQTRLNRSDMLESRTVERAPVPDLPTSFPKIKTPPQPNVSKRIHTVVDGDTLASLAARYLDSESRWQEIFLTNRTSLDDPTVLPIGMKLEIPPRTPYPVQASKPGPLPGSEARQASRPVVPVSEARAVPPSPAYYNAAKPIEKVLETLPNEPLVPMGQ